MDPRHLDKLAGIRTITIPVSAAARAIKKLIKGGFHEKDQPTTGSDDPIYARLRDSIRASGTCSGGSSGSGDENRV